MQSNAGTIPLLNIVYLIYNINPGQVLLEWGRNTDQHAFPLVDLPAVLLEVKSGLQRAGKSTWLFD